MGHVYPLRGMCHVRAAVGRERCSSGGRQLLYSPQPMLCLAYHNIFGLGTAKRNKIGIPEVFKLWEIPLDNKEDSIIARTSEPCRELAIVEFRDSKYFLFVPNVHIFKRGPARFSLHGTCKTKYLNLDPYAREVNTVDDSWTRSADGNSLKIRGLVLRKSDNQGRCD